jgi:hypothetical protein
MGIDVTGLRALLYAKARGADYSHTATLGRQSLHITPKDAMACFREFQVAVSPGEIANIFKSSFAEGLFQQLGAKAIDSLDASSYQHANIIHDLNNPIPEAMKSRYSMVIDRGTIEHIFNFPVAASNLIDMTAPGGHILCVVPVNNFCGHGFYQFSPELFFRTFSRENGCEVLSIFLATIIPGQPWHEVTDPHVLHDRVTLQNYAPTDMIMLAVRRDFAKQAHFAPQQSDYEFGKWTVSQETHPAQMSVRISLVGRLCRLLPLRIQTMLYIVRESIMRSGYRKGYKTITPEALARELLHRRRNV